MDQGTTYEEHKQQLRAAYQAAMSAKRHLASLDTESYLVESIRFLAEDPSSGEGWYERLPWAIFLSMKWAIRSAGLTGVRRKATREDVATVKRLLNCAGPLLRVYRPDSTGTPRVKPFLLLRRMALQQFWYQTKFDEACLGRQASLFMGGRPELYSWEVAFESAYQVTIGEFLKHTAAMVEALSYLMSL